jgi:hypothetical protein
MNLRLRRIFRFAIAPVFSLLFALCASAEPPGKTLIVVAHPDDEYYCAATVYRMAVQLGGSADELIITDGEGGFRYSTLAEPYYGKSLTTEAVAAKSFRRSEGSRQSTPAKCWKSGSTSFSARKTTISH